MSSRDLIQCGRHGQLEARYTCSHLVNWNGTKWPTCSDSDLEIACGQHPVGKPSTTEESYLQIRAHQDQANLQT